MMAGFLLCMMEVCMKEWLLRNKYVRRVLRLFKVKVPPLVLCVGDSLTRGSPGNTGYPEYLQQLTGWLTINAGNPGEASNATDARFLSELKKYRPDLVLLCIGTNDHTLGIKPEYTQGYIQNMIKKAVEEGMSTRLWQFITIQRAVIATPDYSNGIPITQAADNPLYAKLYSAHVISGVLADVMVQPDMRADDVHLNALGYQVLAQRIADEVKAAGLVE